MYKKLSLLAVALIWLAGCGTYTYQHKVQLGQPLDQRESVQYIDPNGKVRYKPAVAPTMDLGAAGDVRFGQRSFVAGGAITNPQRQEQYYEERTVTEKTYADTRGCPLKEQIKEVRNGETTRTETYRSARTLPEQATPLPVYGNADDGPGTKIAGKLIDVGGSFVTGGLYGLLRQPDTTTVTQTGGGGAGYGGDAHSNSEINNSGNSCNTNLNSNKNYNKNTSSSSSKAGATVNNNTGGKGHGCGH